jgi:poly-gamma-glutamate biosynthesis protein PgsC/CapC
MHEYFFSLEVARVALVVGVVVSILFYERVQLTTGGAIVPAYLAMFLPAPVAIVTTLVVAYLTYYLVSVLIAKKRILYGRRKFEVEILVGLVLVAITTVLSGYLSGWDPILLGLSGIGMLIPGVLAHDMYRQGPRKTLLAVTATTAIVALVVFLFASLLAIAPIGTAAPLPPFDENTGYAPELLVAGAVASVLMGLVTFARLGLRSGGFISAAYLALVLPRPLDLLFAVGVALLIWLAVTKLIMPRLLIFGRRKLSTMVLVGAIIAWTAEVVVVHLSGGRYVPWSGFVLMTLMVPALLANDAQRQGLERTLWGAAIGTAGVYGALNLLQAALVAVGWL